MHFSIRLNIGRRHDATSCVETNLPWRFGKGCLSCSSCKNEALAAKKKTHCIHHPTVFFVQPVSLSAFAHCSLLFCVAMLGGSKAPCTVHRFWPLWRTFCWR